MMANVICFDFDDTIVLDNTARQLFERFTGGGWREAEQAYHEGRLSVEQFNAAALDLIEAPADEMQAYAREVAKVREGFLELLDWAHWNDWQAMVVSNGFDLYVDEVLDGLGLDRIVRHTGRTRREYRWRVTYYSPRGIEVQERFKASYAAALANTGDFIAYVGDGASDIEASGFAGAVFARSTLLEALEGTRDRVFRFESFDDVRTILDRESEQWLAERAGAEAVR